MDSMNGSKPVQPPTAAAAAETETVTIQAHVLEAGKTDKGIDAESLNIDEDGTPIPKKAPAGGMKDYFVRMLLIVKRPAANIEYLAGLHLRNKIGPSPHHAMLSQLYRLRRHYAIDERSLWYVGQLTAKVCTNCV
jgi:hypothetical protein